jgi:hypothetical protein
MGMDCEIVVSVTYGLGATVSILVPRHALKGCTVREAIESAIKVPQAPGSPEERTAVMIGEALRSARHLDIELSSGSSGGAGTPVALHDALDLTLSGGNQSDSTERTAMEQELKFSLSEPYRGGGARR